VYTKLLVGYRVRDCRRILAIGYLTGVNDILSTYIPRHDSENSFRRRLTINQQKELFLPPHWIPITKQLFAIEGVFCHSIRGKILLDSLQSNAS
jgi:hypothetical protein